MARSESRLWETPHRAVTSALTVDGRQSIKCNKGHLARGAPPLISPVWKLRRGLVNIPVSATAPQLFRFRLPRLLTVTAVAVLNLTWFFKQNCMHRSRIGYEGLIETSSY